ncbi:MAG: CPBP family glutamic-type intramembrane protease [Cyanobacteria bacterium P01_G01_bin.54]
MDRLRQRLRQSLKRPTVQDWRQTVMVLGAYGAIALPLALHYDLFNWSPWPANQFLSWAGLNLILGKFLLPALAEELLFRVLLLPHPSETVRRRTMLFWLGVSWVLYIASHPLNALTVFPRGNPTFLSPVFLSLAGLLGLACSVLYRQTGSLWAIALVHWLVVVVWLGFGGGEALLVGS